MIDIVDIIYITDICTKLCCEVLRILANVALEALEKGADLVDLEKMLRSLGDFNTSTTKDGVYQESRTDLPNSPPNHPPHTLRLNEKLC